MAYPSSAELESPNSHQFREFSGPEETNARVMQSLLQKDRRTH